jgi:hypothetical protein
MSSNFGSVPKLFFTVDARKTFLLKTLLLSRSGDDCYVIRPLVRGLCSNQDKNMFFIFFIFYYRVVMSMTIYFLFVVIFLPLYCIIGRELLSIARTAKYAIYDLIF